MPLQPHRPPLFCPLSPEAYLLTGRKKIMLLPSLGSSRVTSITRPPAGLLSLRFYWLFSLDFSYIYINKQPGLSFQEKPGCLVKGKKAKNRPFYM
jgi:hypothetical protein